MWLVEVISIQRCVFFYHLYAFDLTLAEPFTLFHPPHIYLYPCILAIISAVLAFIHVWVVNFARVQLIVREQVIKIIWLNQRKQKQEPFQMSQAKINRNCEMPKSSRAGHFLSFLIAHVYFRFWFVICICCCWFCCFAR